MSQSSSSSGIGVCTALFLVFLVLKLAEVEPVGSWSWWTVTAPLWIPWSVCLAIAALLGCVWVGAKAVKAMHR